MYRDPTRRGRLRYLGVDVQPSQTGLVTVHLHLGTPDGREIETSAEGTHTQEGILRAAGWAAVEAVLQEAEGRFDLTLIGAKVVRAFDATIVVVLVRVQSPRRTSRLTGVYAPDDDDLARGAAIAVLDATNRVFTAPDDEPPAEESGDARAEGASDASDAG